MRLAVRYPKFAAFIALALLVPAPSIGVWLAMILEPTRGTAVGMGAYTASKIWILAWPVLWLILIDKQRPGLSPPRYGGLMTGALLGAGIAAAIVIGYFALRPWIDHDAMRDAAIRNGIATPANYVALAVFLTLVNSLLEEFVWRWFVFRKCETLIVGMPSVLLSALFFSAHHFLALHAQTSLTIALLGTLGVFIGGSVWSWCYRRFRSIWPGYVSHIVADVGVFTVGWLVLFGEAGLNP